ITSLYHVGNLPNLEELYLSHNQLTNMEIFDFPHLRILDICNNSIKSIKQIALSNNADGLQLKELWASNNLISDMTELEYLPKTLECVYLDGNMLSLNYRAKIKWSLPLLKQIDSEMISK